MGAVRVIGAGLGRTGTMSLKVALETLGFGPCYHMAVALRRPDHVPFWQSARQGLPIDWHALLRDFGSTTDWPAAAYYRQLMEAFPDAKLVLTVRDPDKWYESAKKTIFKVSQTFPMSWSWWMVPRTRRLNQLRSVIWKDTFHGRFTDRAYALDVYRRHIEQVKASVPADRLLVYDVAEGWEPLCRFLNVPAPDGQPFPRSNDTAEFQERIRNAQRTSWTVLGLAAGVVAVAASGALWTLLR